MKINWALLAVVAFTAMGCSSSTTSDEAKPRAGSQVQALEGGACPAEWYDATLAPNPSWRHQIPTPIQFNDSDQVFAAFPAAIAVLDAFLPPPLKALELQPGSGIGLVGVGLYHHRDIDGVNPYREATFTIVVNDPSALQAGYTPSYPFDMIVTTKLAQYAGVSAFGYPKSLGNPVCSYVGPNGIKCQVESDGKLILKMQLDPTDLVPMPREQPVAPYELLSFNGFEGTSYLVRAPFFTTLVRPDATLSSSPPFPTGGSEASIELGDHPIGQKIAGLVLSKTSVLTSVGRHLHFALDLGACTAL